MKKSDDTSTIFLARDTIFHLYKQCKSRDEAEAYINKWSGKGYIERYELEGDFYYYKDAEFIGKLLRGEVKGPIMGEQLCNQRVHKNFANIILA